MIEEPNQADIDRAFLGTNFGPGAATAEGRRNIVARCVLKSACNFHNGSTITAICKEIGLLTEKGNPRKKAKRWAYCHVFSGVGVAE